jgi:hypothetical protein
MSETIYSLLRKNVTNPTEATTTLSDERTVVFAVLAIIKSSIGGLISYIIYIPQGKIYLVAATSLQDGPIGDTIHRRTRFQEPMSKPMKIGWADYSVCFPAMAPPLFGKQRGKKETEMSQLFDFCNKIEGAVPPQSSHKNTKSTPAVTLSLKDESLAYVGMSSKDVKRCYRTHNASDKRQTIVEVRSSMAELIKEKQRPMNDYELSKRDGVFGTDVSISNIRAAWKETSNQLPLGTLFYRILQIFTGIYNTRCKCL